MKKLAKRAHRLSDLLGDDHDLAVLRAQVEQAGGSFEHEASRTALVAVIDRRRLSLQGDALRLGATIYDPPPKSFGGSVERGWRKRAATHPQPVAG
jgi:hypothetical protein